MKKEWKVASVEVLEMKETAHGLYNPTKEDGDKWTCNATPENPCEAGHTSAGFHGSWGTETASL